MVREVQPIFCIVLRVLQGELGDGSALSSHRSYPVVPEVGKIGHSEQNYILPVAERKDGIKSFFQKQAASPVKAKAKLEHDHVKEDIKPVAETPTESKPKPESKADVKPPRKDAPQVVVVDDDEDEVKPTASQTDTPGKRKREIQDPPRGGRQTKVVRQQPKEESKGVSTCVSHSVADDSNRPSRAFSSRLARRSSATRIHILRHLYYINTHRRSEAHVYRQL